MSETETSADEAVVLPSTSVLMPGTRLTYQLHDEERRERIEEALYRGGGLIVARTESGETNDELPEIATRAEILDAARPHPGRLMVIAGGIERVRFASGAVERDGWAVWEAVDEISAEGRASTARAGDVLGLLDRLSERGVELADSVRGDLVDATPSKVADVVGSVAYDEPARHQKLLEELDVLTRLEQVGAQLDTLLESHGM